MDPLFIPCKFCGKTFEGTEKDLKFTHNFECDSIRNIWVECVTILKLRNINLSAKL
eukprot:Pgem_evm1s1953